MTFCLGSKKTTQIWYVPHSLKILDKGWSSQIKYIAYVLWGNSSRTCRVHCTSTDALCSTCPVGMIHRHHLHTYFTQGNPMKSYHERLPAWLWSARTQQLLKTPLITITITMTHTNSSVVKRTQIIFIYRAVLIGHHLPCRLWLAKGLSSHDEGDNSVQVFSAICNDTWLPYASLCLLTSLSHPRFSIPILWHFIEISFELCFSVSAYTRGTR